MSKTFYGNVFFLGVARMQQYGIVVASYSYNTETDLGGVKQVLEQPNMNMTPGKHYSFAVAQLAWHLIAGNAFSLIVLARK
jgi:predicted enzyme related to lactoylglutathione lyase